MTDSWETPELGELTDIQDAPMNEDFIEELPSFARSGRRRPAILMVIISSVSLSAIVIMRSLTGGLGQVFADSGVEQQVNGFLAFLGSDADDKSHRGSAADPFADLESSNYSAMQVPPERLRSNPFITPWAVASSGSTSRVVTAMTAPQQRALRRRELQSAESHFRIDSVMTGKIPLASINAEVRRVGDRFSIPELDASCRVVSITSEGIALDVHDPDLDLSVTLLIPLHRR